MTPGSESGLWEWNPYSCVDLTGSGSERDIQLTEASTCGYLFQPAPVSGWQIATKERFVTVDPAVATGTWAAPSRPMVYGEPYYSLPWPEFTGAHGEAICCSFVLTPKDLRQLDAGTHTITARLNDPNYLPVELTNTLVVLPATPTASLVSVQTYGQPLPEVSFTGVAGAVVPGSVVQDPPAGSVLSAGWHDVTATLHSASGNYTDLTVTKRIQVNQATPTIVWPQPASIVYGQRFTQEQLNATAVGIGGTTLPADISYTFGGDYVLDAGQYLNRAVARPYDHNYTYATTQRWMTITRAVSSLTTGFDAASGNLTAVLTDTSNHVPLDGRTVTFVGGSGKCTAVTDAAGHAACAIYDVNALSVLTKGFTVSFEGDKNHLPTSKRSTVT